MHSSGVPTVKEEKCVGCGRCVSVCAQSAITLSETASIDEDLCAGCARCLALCPFDAIETHWKVANETMCSKKTEYTMAVIE